MITTVELKLSGKHAPGNASEERTIYYLIRQGKENAIIPTPYKILTKEWDLRICAIGNPLDESRRLLLKYIQERVWHELSLIRGIISRLETASASIPDILRAIHDETERRQLLPFVAELEKELTGKGHVRTAETYRASIRSFMKFYSSERHYLPPELLSRPMIDDLTPRLIDEYQTYLERKGRTKNTISFYMRTLRAIYNRAADLDIINQQRPLRNAYTGVCRTIKRALPMHLITRIKELDLSKSPDLEFARDIFMLSFCLRGMSFIDMAFLRRTDLRRGYITYSRRKTGQTLKIAWTAEMKEFLRKHASRHPVYLLPLIPGNSINERSAYKNASYKINRALHRIGMMAGIKTPLTLYVARHSWASAAKAKGIPLGIISEGMGHESEKTTRIYLSSFDNSAIDRANRLILRSI